MICEYLDTCSFIQHVSNIVPFTMNMIKVRYCELDKTKCARYRLAKICYMEMIPYNLRPSDDMKAMELVESKLNETCQKLYGNGREEISACSASSLGLNEKEICKPETPNL